MKYFLKPWEHQLEAIEFAKTQRDLALFWEMGTGKTMTTVNIIRHRFAKRERVMKTLILCPIVVVQNWKDEWIKNSDTDPRFIVTLKGTGKKKAEQMERVIRDGGMRVVIGNYEIMQNKKILSYLEHWQPEILVCDESQRLKSHTSKRAKAVAKLAETCNAGRILLSGTPILNSPMDLFQQFKVLDAGETFGKNFFGFRAKFFYDKNAKMPKNVHFPNWQPKPTSFTQFSTLLADKSLRKTKEECLDLPPLIKESRYVELSPEQRKAYKEMSQDFITFIKNKKGEGKAEAVIAELAITKALRLQQIASGFVVTDDGKTIAFDKNPRIECLKELLEEITPHSKVIVWSCFKENYRQIRELCEKLNINYAQLHGGIKDKDKEINKFRGKEEARVMIANPQSAGLGVNLVEAKYSIYFSKNFSLENDLQSEARNHRGGSEIHDKITRIDLVAEDTLDEQVNKALANKVNIAEQILDIKP